MDANGMQQGIVHTFDLIWYVLCYFIVTPSIGVTSCNIALGESFVAKSAPLCNEGGKWFAFFIQFYRVVAISCIQNSFLSALWDLAC